jgi:hypothetical protein
MRELEAPALAMNLLSARNVSVKWQCNRKVECMVRPALSQQAHTFFQTLIRTKMNVSTRLEAT